MKTTKFQITASAYLCWAMFVLLLPLNWLVGWIIAVSIHEAGHLAVLIICRIPVHEVCIGLTGARISTAPLTDLQELICAAAGPIFSFLPLLAVNLIPTVALIGFVQGMFNLIPIYPLDGGRILRSAAAMIRNRRGT